MAQVDSCLKRTFIGLNFLLAVVGGVTIALAVLSQTFTSHEGEKNQLEDQTVGLTLMYVVGAVTMVIAAIGAYGAHKESKACLVVFKVFMITGSLLLLRFGIPVAIARPMVKDMLKEEFHKVVPLDTADGDVKQMMDTVQTHMHCCGLFDYTDWSGNIPDSCNCRKIAERKENECQEVEYRNFFQMGTKTIYGKPCYPIIEHYAMMALDIGIGFIFFLAALAVLSTILSFIMIRQLRPPRRSSMLLTTTTISSPDPPKYQELYKQPPPQY